MADDKNTANTSPFPEGYQPQSRRERREMEEYFARLAAEKTADEKTATEQNAAAKNAEREETTDEESAADVETTKDFSEMTPKERRKAKRAEQAELTYSQAQEEGRLGEWLWVQAREGGTVILYALVIAFLVKTFLLRGFYIPSGSMEQTLQVNDRVFINVAGSYFSEPKRGDVIVFKDSQGWIPSTQKTSSPLKDALSFAGILPDTSSNFLVKRVIGTPGDVVESDGNGKIKVNGVEITEPYLYPGPPASTSSWVTTAATPPTPATTLATAPRSSPRTTCRVTCSWWRGR